MDRPTMQTLVKKALSETVPLSDGRYGYIISEAHAYGQDKWECHICPRIIKTERAMLMHLSHPLHLNKLRAPSHPPQNFKRKITKEEARRNLESTKSPSKNEDKPWVATDTIDPGEPIPPGMEDVVNKYCQIQEALDNHPGPLIGIEYIVELISSESPCEPKYICLLCEKKGDPRSVMVHLASHYHALRYISCFFRTAGNALNMIPKVREYRKGMCTAVQKIAEEIEKLYGRLKPTSAILETYTQQKHDILRSIDEKEHFRETPNTTFLEYCSLEKIKEFAEEAEAEILKPGNSRLEDDLKQSNSDLAPKSAFSSDPKTPELKDSKLSFSIGKPERTLGRNNKSGEPNKPSKSEEEVILVESPSDKIIEIHSMSSISSDSDLDDKKKNRVHPRARSRSRSLGRGGRRSPYRYKSPTRRRLSPYRDTRFKRRTRSRSISPRSRRAREDERYRREIDKIYSRDRRSRSRERARYEGRRYRKSKSPERDNKRRMSPYRSSRHSKSPHKSKYHHDKSPEVKKKKSLSEYEKKMDAYRAKLHELEVEMDKKFKYYKERPEKHPQYSDEWKSFWNRRYKELQQAGKDPTGYDFKQEWIVFWDERVKQLHEEELALKKEDLKELMPLEEKGPSSDLQDVSPPTPENARDVTVDDIKNTWKALTGTDIKAPPKSNSSPPPEKSPVRRSPSPWESKEDIRKPRKIATYTADPPIVHCLRMLSVIEHQLGSLGPKALDLLSRAILMEKVKTNESMTLLHDPEVHIFFETVKEKIRGQLIAGIVVKYLVHSCKSLINIIENMLASHPLKPKLPPPPKTHSFAPEPVQVAGVGLVNKMAVAQQIAEVLVAQGRTDVSQQELEELINAVVGIASTTNTNVNQSSAAAFISQLNIQNSTANPHINELLSNLISSAQKSIAPQPSPSVIEKPLEKTAELTVSTTQLSTSDVLPTVPLLQPSPVLNPSQNPAKAFSEAVSAAKATVSELALSTPKPVNITPIKEKPLFPIKEPASLINTEPAAGIGQKKSAEEKIIEKEKNLQISDEDLKERLMKFKSLSRDEQQSLIALLKDLEGKEPERVEKLRKYVTANLTQTPTNPAPAKTEVDNSRLSPFSSRAGGTNPAPEEKSKPLLADSDNEDDDDYSVEDVYKSVTEKLKKKEIEKKPELKTSQSEFSEESSNVSRFSNPSRPLNTYLSKEASAAESREQLQQPYSATSREDQPIMRTGWPRNMFLGASSIQTPPQTAVVTREETNSYTQGSQYKQPHQYFQNETDHSYRGTSSTSLPPTGGGYQPQASSESQYPQMHGAPPTDRHYPSQGGMTDSQFHLQGNAPPYSGHFPMNNQQQYSNSQQQLPYNSQRTAPYNYQRPQGQNNYYGNYGHY